MPRPRLPQEKAEVSGATVINPGRFKGRSKPAGTRPLGEPYVAMTDEQKEAWAEFRADLPWLNSSHRSLLQAACILKVRMSAPDVGIQAIQAFAAILSKLGATPTDETKVNHGDGEPEDPTDRFFGPH